MTRSLVPELRRQFVDVAVIYPSPQTKGRWIAHSINTDQIGVGDCVLDAYIELVRALTALLTAANTDPSIEVLRRAPDDICEKLKTAKALPKEILEIATLRLTGRFPVTLDRPWSTREHAFAVPVTVST